MQVQRTQLHFSNFLLVIWTTTHLKHIYNPSRQPAYCNLVFSSIYLGQWCKLSHLSLWSLFPFHIFTHTAFFLLTAFKVLYSQFLRTHSPNSFFIYKNETTQKIPLFISYFMASGNNPPFLQRQETKPLFTVWGTAVSSLFAFFEFGFLFFLRKPQTRKSLRLPHVCSAPNTIQFLHTSLKKRFRLKFRGHVAFPKSSWWLSPLSSGP